MYSNSRNIRTVYENQSLNMEAPYKLHIYTVACSFTLKFLEKVVFLYRPQLNVSLRFIPIMLEHFSPLQK